MACYTLNLTWFNPMWCFLKIQIWNFWYNKAFHQSWQGVLLGWLIWFMQWSNPSSMRGKTTRLTNLIYAMKQSIKYEREHPATDWSEWYNKAIHQSWPGAPLDWLIWFMQSSNPSRMRGSTMQLTDLLCNAGK